MLCGRNGALLLALISVVQVSCVSSSTEAVGIEELFSQEARQEPSGIFDLIGGRSWLLLRLLLMAVGCLSCRACLLFEPHYLLLWHRPSPVFRVILKCQLTT
jgi:hypothetical protein